MPVTTARKGTKDGELLLHEESNSAETTVSSSIDVAKAPIVQSNNIMTNINKNATRSQVANNNIGTSVSSNNGAGAKGKHGINKKGGAPGYPSIHTYRTTAPPPPTNTTTTQRGGGGKQQKQKGSKNGSGGSGAPSMNMHGIPPPRWNGTFFLFVKSFMLCHTLFCLFGENMSYIYACHLCFICTVW